MSLPSPSTHWHSAAATALLLQAAQWAAAAVRRPALQRRTVQPLQARMMVQDPTSGVEFPLGQRFWCGAAAARVAGMAGLLAAALRLACMHRQASSLPPAALYPQTQGGR